MRIYSQNPIHNYLSELFPVLSDNGKYSYKSLDGKIETPAKFLSDFLFEGSLAKICFYDGNGNLCEGYLTKNGEELLTNKYDHVSFKGENNHYVVQCGEYYGSINGCGKEIVKCKYFYLDEFSEDLCGFMSLNKKRGYIDTLGNVIIPAIYSSVSHFHEGLAIVSDDIHDYIINPQGQKIAIFPRKTFSFLSCFFESKAVIIKNGKYGYINTKGNIIIPCKFDYASSFINGMAKVKMNKKYGLINDKGFLICPCIFEEIYPTEDSFAWVEKDQMYGAIDKNGNILIDYIYQDVSIGSVGYHLVKRDGMWGAIDKKGRSILDCTYNNSRTALYYTLVKLNFIK